MLTLFLIVLVSQSQGQQAPVRDGGSRAAKKKLDGGTLSSGADAGVSRTIRVGPAEKAVVPSGKRRRGTADSGKTADAGVAPSMTTTAEVNAPTRVPSSRDWEPILSKPMRAKWQFLADEIAQQETHRDYTLGFLVSKEFNSCACTRIQPAAMVRALEKNEGGEKGLALIEAEDAANTQCVVCAIDAFHVWKKRIEPQCVDLLSRSAKELEAIKKSEDAKGIPPHCFEEAFAHQPDAGAPPQPTSPPTSAAPPPVAAPTPTSTPAPAAQPLVIGDAGLDSNWVKINGYTYYRPLVTAKDGGFVLPATPAVAEAKTTPVDAGAGRAAMPPPTPAQGPPIPGPGLPLAAATTADHFVAPVAWAPVPPREDERMYVRLSMSSACVAEILPGPIQARNGDLLLLPFGVPWVIVKSPCGGLAEIYWGREPKPRYSEVFGRNEALKFEFRK